MVTGIIYKIVCNKTGKVYFGSSKRNVTEKMEEHQRNYGDFKKGTYKFQAPFEIFKCGNYEYILLETMDCGHEFELKNKMLKYIEENDCINKCFIDKVQKKISKKYREAHVEESKAYNKAYRDTHKEEKKAYREANKDEINKKRRQQRLEQKQLKEQTN